MTTLLQAAVIMGKPESVATGPNDTTVITWNGPTERGETALVMAAFQPTTGDPGAWKLQRIIMASVHF